MVEVDDGRWPHTGVLLAGGASRRMGAPKAGLPWREGTLGGTVLATLRAVCRDVVIAGHGAGLHEGAARRLPDLQPGLGPLAGVEVALASGLDAHYLVCACDAPHLGVPALRRLATAAPEAPAACFADADGRRTPLPLRIHADMLAPLRAYLAAGQRSVHGFLDAIGAARIVASDAELAHLGGVNTPADLARSQTGAPPPCTNDALCQVTVDHIAAGRARVQDDLVVREEPLEIRVHGVALAVTMRTPGHDEELVTGFLLTEGVAASPREVASVRHCTAVSDPDAEDNVVQVTLAPGVAVDLEKLRRNFYATSSCGICGKATLQAALGAAPALDDGARFDASFFPPLPARLREAQVVFDRTGGLHAAGLFAADGTLVVAREDVGRHNAVDKVVGHAARAGRWPLGGLVLAVSGRISYEIAQKALMARIPVVAAVSAPSSLAVELAEAAGMTLVGFLRGDTMNVYGARGRVRG
jgi:FdhD protein